MSERTFSRRLIGKSVVSKTGKKLGIVSDLVFEIRTGELVHFVLDKPSPHVENMNLEKSKHGDLLVPFSAVSATEDFVIINEEDVI